MNSQRKKGFSLFSVNGVVLVGIVAALLLYFTTDQNQKTVHIQQPQQPQQPPTANITPEVTTPTPEETHALIVTSQIVKKTKGKYRYFFNIRNVDQRPFAGSVKITLLNSQSGVRNGDDTFHATSPIDPQSNRVVYVETSDAPVRQQNGLGVDQFSYVAKVNGKVVDSATGPVTDNFEDLSSP